MKICKSYNVYSFGLIHFAGTVCLKVHRFLFNTKERADLWTSAKKITNNVILLKYHASLQNTLPS